MIKAIYTMDDVEIFTKELIEEGDNIHPDDDFRDLINTETNEPSFTEEEAEIRNKLMEQCFEVCEKNGVDIYDFSMEIYLKETGLDKFIPLPSSIKED